MWVTRKVVLVLSLIKSILNLSSLYAPHVKSCFLAKLKHSYLISLRVLPASKEEALHKSLKISTAVDLITSATPKLFFSINPVVSVVIDCL